MIEAYLGIKAQIKRSTITRPGAEMRGSAARRKRVSGVPRYWPLRVILLLLMGFRRERMSFVRVPSGASGKGGRAKTKRSHKLSREH